MKTRPSQQRQSFVSQSRSHYVPRYTQSVQNGKRFHNIHKGHRPVELCHPLLSQAPTPRLTNPIHDPSSDMLSRSLNLEARCKLTLAAKHFLVRFAELKINWLRDRKTAFVINLYSCEMYNMYNLMHQAEGRICIGLLWNE